LQILRILHRNMRAKQFVDHQLRQHDSYGGSSQ